MNLSNANLTELYLYPIVKAEPLGESAVNLPSFEHVVTVLAITTTLAGVWLGSNLSRRSTADQWDREVEKVNADAMRSRVVALMQLMLAHEVALRTVVGYLQRERDGVPDAVGHREAQIIELNLINERVNDAVVEVQLLGPAWASDYATAADTKAEECVTIYNQSNALSNLELLQRLSDELRQMRLSALSDFATRVLTDGAK